MIILFLHFRWETTKQAEVLMQHIQRRCFLTGKLISTYGTAKVVLIVGQGNAMWLALAHEFEKLMGRPLAQLAEERDNPDGLIPGLSCFRGGRRRAGVVKVMSVEIFRYAASPEQLEKFMSVLKAVRYVQLQGEEDLRHAMTRSYDYGKIARALTQERARLDRQFSISTRRRGRNRRRPTNMSSTAPIR